MLTRRAHSEPVNECNCDVTTTIGGSLRCVSPFSAHCWFIDCRKYLILRQFRVDSELIVRALTSIGRRVDAATMLATYFRIDSTFGSVLVIALVAATAQEVPVTTKQSNAGQLTGERDQEKEDLVAKLFEGIRGDAKLPHLKRIGHRESLEQKVCTIVLTGKPPKYTSTNTSGFYKTANPASVTPELSNVALFNNLHPKNNPSYARYSVAVWPAKDSQTGEAMYWVGIQLFWSAGMEFFDYHFTDDIYYHNDWKKSIAPPCRNK